MKSIILFATLAILLISSCSLEGTDSSGTETTVIPKVYSKDITGKWYLNQYKLNVYNSDYNKTYEVVATYDHLFDEFLCGAFLEITNNSIILMDNREHYMNKPINAKEFHHYLFYFDTTRITLDTSTSSFTDSYQQEFTYTIENDVLKISRVDHQRSYNAYSVSFKRYTDTYPPQSWSNFNLEDITETSDSLEKPYDLSKSSRDTRYSFHRKEEYIVTDEDFFFFTPESGKQYSLLERSEFEYPSVYIYKIPNSALSSFKTPKSNLDTDIFISDNGTRVNLDSYLDTAIVEKFNLTRNSYWKCYDLPETEDSTFVFWIEAETPIFYNLWIEEI